MGGAFQPNRRRRDGALRAQASLPAAAPTAQVSRPAAAPNAQVSRPAAAPNAQVSRPVAAPTAQSPATPLPPPASGPHSVSTPLKSSQLVGEQQQRPSAHTDTVIGPPLVPVLPALRSTPVNLLRATQPDGVRSSPSRNSKNIFASSLPPQFQKGSSVLKLLEVISFLMEHRPGDLEPFSSAAFDLYRQQFSRSARANAKLKISQGQPIDSNVHNGSLPLLSQQPDKGPALNAMAPHDVVVVTPSSARVRAMSHSPHPGVIELDSSPAVRPQQHGSLLITSKSPNMMPAHLDLSGRNLEVVDSARMQSKKGLVVPYAHPAREEPFAQKPRIAKPPLIRRSQELKIALSKRHDVFLQTQKPLPPMIERGTSYVIWRDPEQSSLPPDKREVLLSASSCHSHKGLLDASEKLLPIHLKVLRFLWSYLVVDPCSGSIFSHGIGFPRHHVIFMFAQLYCTTLADDGRKKILIIVPDSSWELWSRAGPNFTLPEFKVGHFATNSWHDDIKLWNSHGGALLSSFNEFETVFGQEGSGKNNFEALVALSVPGPDIVIIDEAFHLTFCNSNILGCLNRFKTKARLALTSMPIGGNLAAMAAISEWACPNLLDSELGFWSRFVRPIAEGNRNDASLELGRRAHASAQRLWHRLQSVTCEVEPSERREALSSYGKELFETQIIVNLAPFESKIYKHVSRVLSAAASMGDISYHLACHILSIAATSTSALLKAIDNFIRFDSEFTEIIDDQGRKRSPTYFHYFGMVGSIEKAILCLRRLRDSLAPMLSDSEMESRKMLALKAMLRLFMKSEDRVVIYTSCDELQMEVLQQLKDLDLDGENGNEEQAVFHYNLDEDKMEAASEVCLFNVCKHKAVLVAPYGVEMGCMEDCGWSYVNATKVIMLNSIWDVQPVVQALNRVHNFARKGAREVDIFYVDASGTVDDCLAPSILRRYEELKESAALGSIGQSPFQIHPRAEYRGYLVEPELPPAILKYDKSLDITKVNPGPPNINRSSTKDLSRAREEVLGNIVTSVMALPVKEDDRLPSSSILFSVSRYEKYSEVLEKAFPRGSEVSGQTSITDDDQHDQMFLADLKERLDQIRCVVDRHRGKIEQPFWEEMNEVSSIYSVPGRQRNGLMELWKRYFYLYERGSLGMAGKDELIEQRGFDSNTNVVDIKMRRPIDLDHHHKDESILIEEDRKEASNWKRHGQNGAFQDQHWPSRQSDDYLELDRGPDDERESTGNGWNSAVDRQGRGRGDLLEINTENARRRLSYPPLSHGTDHDRYSPLKRRNSDRKRRLPHDDVELALHGDRRGPPPPQRLRYDN